MGSFILGIVAAMLLPGNPNDRMAGAVSLVIWGAMGTIVRTIISMAMKRAAGKHAMSVVDRPQKISEDRETDKGPE